MIVAFAYILLLSTLLPLTTHAESVDTIPLASDALSTKEPRIADIQIRGNVNVPTPAIRIRLPLRLQDVVNPIKVRAAIHHLYQLGYFKNVAIYSTFIDDDTVRLFVVVEEKPLKKDVIFEGNDHLGEKEIEKKIQFAKIPALDENDIQYFALILKSLYAAKNYHTVAIEPRLEHQDNAVTAYFSIKEGKKALVKRILFTGNTHLSTKKLKSTILTKEDWVLGFYDHSGFYHPGMLDHDRYLIETLYQNKGFLEAKVTEVTFTKDPETEYIYLTFHIHEGPQYTIKTVNVQGNEYLTQEELLERIPLKEGQLYSREKIQQSIETLRTLWGEHGFIFADIEPSVQTDEENHTVAITFFNNLGNKIYLNRVAVIGNKKTRDRVIRRNILLEEGEVITTQKMDASRNQVELLGYFDKRNGVNWKINRLSDTTADLELHLQEIRTGQLFFQMNMGGDPEDPLDKAAKNNFIRKLKAQIGWNDPNFFGHGIRIACSGELSFAEQNISFNIANPWMFNRPVLAELGGFYKNIIYEDIFDVNKEVKEHRTSLFSGLGFYLPFGTIVRGTAQFGGEVLRYSNKPTASPLITDAQERSEFQAMLNRRFQDGFFLIVAGNLSEDLRNHPMFPSQGYQWNLITKLGIPVEGAQLHHNWNDLKNRYGFLKAEADATWYTPLIGDTDLVLCVHGHAGFIHKFSDCLIPYRELFHIGGPATVRGFTFGEIGPSFRRTSLGGTRTLFTNIELMFPVLSDFSITGHIFYDGGAGWNTPDAACISPSNLRNNQFDYRHAIGVGLRIFHPMPVQIEYGIKLDARPGEQHAQFSLSMNHYY